MRGGRRRRSAFWSECWTACGSCGCRVCSRQRVARLRCSRAPGGSSRRSSASGARADVDGAAAEALLPLSQRLVGWQHTLPPPLKKPSALNEYELLPDISIVDLGNSCWTHKHFSQDIQTRQYRCPEVILGADYDTSADMWSVACLGFELLTGELLFDPRSGDNYTRDEDHLAQVIELVGPFPKKMAITGRYAKDFFTKKGALKHIHELKPWRLSKGMREPQAAAAAACVAGCGPTLLTLAASLPAAVAAPTDSALLVRAQC